jgi:hypothetical protein
MEDLTRSSPSEISLPEAMSKALGISLSEVLNLYFGELDKGTRDRMVWDAIDRHRKKTCTYYGRIVIGLTRPSSGRIIKMIRSELLIYLCCELSIGCP